MPLFYHKYVNYVLAHSVNYVITLYRYTPTNAYGKRESHNIYAKTREECEEKLAEMIAEVKAQIKAEKEKMTG